MVTRVIPLLLFAYASVLCRSLKKNHENFAILLTMKSLHLTRPRAIMMVGLPGSGKSFFAKKFSEMFNLPYIDSLSIESYATDSKAASELIALTLGELVKTGQSIVFEGNSDSRVRRTEFGKWARSHGYQPMFIWVQADRATSLSRTLKAKSLTRDQFETVVRDFSSPHPGEHAVVISGKHTYATQAKVVLGQLSKENRPAQTTITAPERPSVRTISVN